MTINEYIFVAAVIVFIIGFALDELNYIGYLLLTVLFVKDFDHHFMYKILLFIVLYPTIVILHYKFIRKFILKILDNFLVKEKLKTGVSSLIGKEVKVVKINGHYFAKVDGVSFSIENEDNLKENSVFTVSSIVNGKLKVEEK